ncbi:AraC family transcriptional regulator [Reichenbachiella carrageenanivorans]|uniref:AraC family transcriptional regulator n=1 Tax=Reichenbachiella carrageenanivorans TaxID=2979869 RepID=A0ABY6D4G3_9BACT|nr:AraC family transcriptional regulator [Reichenbachiella carrageenanivorans]UXX81047.1 AraC family transcriptional regulator [Reichenbachiella carrageenanivorans]
MKAEQELFFKYLTVSDVDLKWGLYITAGGYEKIKPKSVYPSIGHPSTYYFEYDSGRILKEYQILYITNGKGTFQSKKAGKIRVNEGTIIMLYPDEWHSYRPDKSTGWDEFWFGLKGPMVQNILESGDFFTKKEPLIQIGHREFIFQLFEQIIETIRNEPPAYQQIASGMAMHLLGRLFAISKIKLFEGKQVESQIRKAIIIFRENTSSNISPEIVADQLNMGYSWFRRMFKNYTGLSPAKYFQQMKMQHAKEFLLTTDKPIKEISYELGFDSIFYFSRQFKKVTGFAPSEYKKAHRLIDS